ncbi:hypothetical protein [Streptomyces longisporoflavus]|uniref:Uncharacterized protein n=1 Tax=Streptomyces longisporoflavus TaxID=28044 RepID=A0ABW7R220_9ACTN
MWRIAAERGRDAASMREIMTLRVFSAYYARSLTDPATAAVFLSDGHPLEELVTGFVATAQPSGQTAPGQDVLHERRTLDDVRETPDYHLAKIFSPVRPQHA